VSIPVVYDTMVFLQAASRPERTHATFQAIRDGRVTLTVSAEILAEVQDVLNREEVHAKFPALTPEAVGVFIADVLAHATLIDPVARVFTWPQHPDDDHLINAAIAANARHLVTWETRLLKLGTDNTAAAKLLRQLAPNLTIITPRQLADAIRLPTGP